jgi:hypothetical protein
MKKLSVDVGKLSFEKEKIIFPDSLNLSNLRGVQDQQFKVDLAHPFFLKLESGG